MIIYVGRLIKAGKYYFFESNGIESNACENEEIGRVILLGDIDTIWEEGDFLMILIKQSLSELEENPYSRIAKYRMFINRDRRITKIQKSDYITIEDGIYRKRESRFTYWGFDKTININNKSISFLTKGFEGANIQKEVKDFLLSFDLSLALVFDEVPKEHDSTDFAIDNKEISKRTRFPNRTETEKKHLTIDIASIEKRIAEFEYKNRLSKDGEVENKKFPMFASEFYNLLFIDSTISAPKRVFEKYLSERDYFYHTDDGRWIVNYEKSIRFFSINALEGRFYRAISSLVRDFHFYCLASASKYFDRVIYSTYDDIYLKTDITVLLNGSKYAIGLALGTTKSIDYIKQKDNRHNPNIKVIYCLLGSPTDAPGVNPRDAKAAGQLYLYTMNHIENLFRYISKQDGVLKNNCLLYPDGKEEEF